MQAPNETANEPLFSSSEKNQRQNQRGVALLLVIICSILFALLGLSLPFSAMTEFSMSTESGAWDRPC